MEKEFIPYEQALALKELGFDEPCIACYTQNAFGSTPEQKVQYWREPIGGNDDYVFVLAPLYQQAFEYILKSYLKNYSIKMFRDSSGAFYDDDDYLTDFMDKDSCLKKLIEIVKQNKHGRTKS